MKTPLEIAHEIYYAEMPAGMHATVRPYYTEMITLLEKAVIAGIEAGRTEGEQ